ncbi:MAG: ribbon-helix-helix domain-containing protein [Yaniella sp.]|uniref:type II toxin-antitoxin system RelB family antitoxin n=1 Tax=Yaniella sp. TaxID=2773929 RepID=UPI0026487A41|nr:ribbon-helix-helix domain-containing protein [Yaniella sp.]MDN5705197.1 ribbon-helix-helix domain-containing protein [Yaniella sp.]MDN5732358.1 ribbon-helix-helix domain-containing protein [Yaniella sp.]MDN5743164.1 ribbon-helix-helix domain-containing protein [Yaniella sp.]MDN5816504.1 ribbon-helix-helix domain-containing protein [Yaniella sp.]MDN5818802.1 ribbon-helix-helix domain-containing protein [Yaniella sp.]
MTKTQLNVRIDHELDNRLAELAKRTGRTKSFYTVEAIKEFLEDQEDYYLAKDSLAEFQDSGEAAIDMEDVDWDNTNR